MMWVSRKEFERLVSRVKYLEERPAPVIEKEEVIIDYGTWSQEPPMCQNNMIFLGQGHWNGRHTISVSQAIQMILNHLKLKFEWNRGTPEHAVLTKETK